MKYIEASPTCSVTRQPNRISYRPSQKLVFSAFLVAVAIVVNRVTSVVVPIGGAPAMIISFGNPFLRFVAFMFGPVFGGSAAVASDLIGFLLKPTGAFMWQFTAVAFFRGFLVGLMWNLTKKIDAHLLSNLYWVLFVGSCLLGIAHLCIPLLFPQSVYHLFLLNFGKRADYVSYGLLLFGILGILVQTIAFLWSRKTNSTSDSNLFIRLLAVLGPPNLLMNLVNTNLIYHYVLSSSVPFVYVWLPRFIEELCTIMLHAYILVAMIKLYELVFKRSIE